VPSPYREVEATKPPEPVSAELHYRPRGRVDTVSAWRSGLHLVTVPTAAGVVLAAAVTVEAGVIGFLAALAGVAWWSRKHPKDVIVLRVSGGELSVLPMGSKRESFRVKLAELDDVVLETRQVERVMDVGPNVVNIGMGPIAPGIASATDTKRIVLEPARGEPHVLTKDFFGHAETTEWFAKLRLFLRKAGWVPLAEREETDEDPEDDDDDDEP
jgi:hypothetical protein